MKKYGATIIAENILSQVEDDGLTFYHKLRMTIFASPLPQAFTDYRKDSSVAVSKMDRYVENGRKRPRKTKKGWQLKVKLSDGSISWLDLKASK